MNDRLPTAPAIGRLLLSLIFIASGLSKLAAPAATQGYIAANGLPAPLLAYAVAIVVELGGGLALLAGFKARWAAAALAVLSLVTAVIFHRDFADQNMMIHFMKNLAIAGGLIYVVAFGAGAYSLDRLIENTRAANTGRGLGRAV